MMLAALDAEWFATLMLVWVLGFLAYYYWIQLFQASSIQPRVPFTLWITRGLFGAWAGWLLMNSGWLSGLAPLHPEAFEALNTTGMPPGSFLNALRPTFGSITAVWAAFTFLWMTLLIAWHCEDRKAWAITAGIWVLFFTPLAALAITAGKLEGVPYAVLCLTVPIVHQTLDKLAARPPVPIYARAIARIKRGRYSEAEQEVIQQLEKCQDDIDGWLMLADLYANQFRELAEADRTIRELCDQPNVTPAQATVALHKLADWHLSLGENPAAARSALSEVLRRFPGSHFAFMAQQRIDQLPETSEELREKRLPRSIRLPSLTEEIDAPMQAQIPPADAKKRADQLVQRLTRNPNDSSSREEFAILLAGPLRQPDLAIDQLSLLIDLPEESIARKAEWLASIARWQLQMPHRLGAARQTLDRIQRDCPGTPQALAARRRLDLLNQESARTTFADLASPATPRLRVELPPGVSMSQTREVP